MDVLTKAQRSFSMSQVKAKNTKPELLLKKFLKELKIPFKENCKNLIGKPDIYIPEINQVIQINGCFWHGHKKCKYFVIPKTNTSFWIKKINANIQRDEKNTQLLKKSNLKVCILWECELKNGSFLDKVLSLFKESFL